tara:strand:+ start:3238 stop:4662 length:1425 start_codon:yes stop_codon:yes gene_type:complete
MAITPVQLNRRAFTRNSISIEGIRKSVGDLSSALSKSNSITRALAKQTFETTKFKATLIDKDASYFRKRRENIRRKEREDLIEASKVGGTIKKSGSIMTNSSRGFLGRILDTVGVLLVGWSVANFTKIIGQSEFFIKSITRTLREIDFFMEGVLDLFESVARMVKNTSMALDLNGRSVNDDKEDLENAIDFVNVEFAESEKTILNDVISYKDPDQMGFGNVKKEFLENPGQVKGVKGSGDGAKSGEDVKVTVDNYFGQKVSTSKYIERESSKISYSDVSEDAITMSIQYEDGVVSVYKRLGGGEFERVTSFPDGTEDTEVFQAFKKGGLVTGTGNEDTIPALLTPGEFVITAETVEKLGSEFFTALNSISNSNIIPDMKQKLKVSESGEVVYNFIEVIADNVEKIDFDVPKVNEVRSNDLNSSYNNEQVIVVPIPKRKPSSSGSVKRSRTSSLPDTRSGVNMMRVLSDLELSYT